MKKMNKQLKYSLISFAIALLAFVTLFEYFDSFENILEDARFKNKYASGNVREGSIKDIVIVDIDGRSEKKFGNYFSWDTRAIYSKVVKNLTKKKVKSVNFDILLRESKDERKDSLLQEEIISSNKTILGYNFQQSDTSYFVYPDSVAPRNSKTIANSLLQDNYLTPSWGLIDLGSINLNNAARTSGYLNMLLDDDGVIRSTSLFINYLGRLYPSFSLQIALDYLNATTDSLILNNGENVIIRNAKSDFDSVYHDITIPLNSDNEMIIHYKGTWKTYRTVSLYDIVENRIGRKTLKNKITLIGTSLRGLFDLRSVPVAENIPGVEVHANIINTIIKEDFIKRIDKTLIALLMIIFMIITIYLVFNKFRIYISLVIITAYSLGYYFLTIKLFNDYNFMLDQSRPLYAIVFSFIIAYVIKFYLEEQDKQFVKYTLGRYVPQSVSDIMLEDSSKMILGGERKVISMFFSDIRSFTTMSEQVKPDVLVKFLNNYLTRMTALIKKYEGTIDKYEGDAIICFFGAPLNNPNHPVNACHTALDMLDALELLKSNEKDIVDPIFKDVKVGIGINSGDVTVGNIGSDELFDYTAIGDNMNLAARIEGLTKQYGVDILISENTKEMIGNDIFITRKVDTVKVKGKNKAVTLYELIGKKDNLNNPKVLLYNNIKERYEQALKLYSDGSFEKAKVIFSDILDCSTIDKPSSILLKRCEQMINEKIKRETGIPLKWSGIWEMNEK